MMTAKMKCYKRFIWLFSIILLIQTNQISGSIKLPATENLSLSPRNGTFGDLFGGQIADHSKDDILPECVSFLKEFSKQAADFIKCSVVNARPFRFCEMCADHYIKAVRVYQDIQHNDETLDDCRGILLNSDRVQIIKTVKECITDIWTRADCNKCFAVLQENNNGTVTENLTADTKKFVSLYINFTNCIPKNVTMGKKGHVYNLTVCQDCKYFYDSMNNLYNKMRVKEDSPQPVCMDIVDMMNYTRIMWGETLGCTVTYRDGIAVITITCVLLFIPVAFYVGLAVYGTKKQRKVIQEKRLSKFSTSNNYGSTENTPLLYRSYDITASLQGTQHQAESLSDEENNVYQRSHGNRNINSNQLHNRRTENHIS